MKRFFILAVCSLCSIVGLSASAQSGLNNNSNWKTPIPSVILPQSPTGGGPAVPTPSNITPTTIQLPAVPTLPPINIINIPIVPSMTATALLPSMPSPPLSPTAPTANFVSAVSGGIALVSLPLLPYLPPVAPIAPVPELRLVIKP